MGHPFSNKNHVLSRMAVMPIFYVILIFTTLSCHHTKNVSKSSKTTTTAPSSAQPPIQNFQKADEKAEALLKQLNQNIITFNELAIKLKTKINSSEINQSFTTNIRWKKNEKIWLSMSIIGIEGARVLITKDSIKIMDKINNRYILKPISYISQKALVHLSFSDIESILLGQLFFTDTTKAKYVENVTNITINADGLRYLTNIVFDKITKNPTYIFITDKQNEQTIEAQYTNYQQQLGKQFPMDRELKMKSDSRFFEMSAKIQNIEIKQNLEYPFSINPSYKFE